MSVLRQLSQETTCSPTVVSFNIVSRARSGEAARHSRPGNQLTLRLLSAGTVQSTLSINARGDKFEREADRVADQVMRVPDPEAGGLPTVRRACPRCQKELRQERTSVCAPNAKRRYTASRARTARRRRFTPIWRPRSPLSVAGENRCRIVCGSSLSRALPTTSATSESHWWTDRRDGAQCRCTALTMHNHIVFAPGQATLCLLLSEVPGVRRVGQLWLHLLRLFSQGILAMSVTGSVTEACGAVPEEMTHAL